MGFNLQPGGGSERSSGLASVGDATTATGPGPFVMDGMSNDGHYFRYAGTDAVDLTLPVYMSDAWWSAGYLFAVVNVGSGGASVDVYDGNGVSLGVTLGIGESAVFVHRFDGHYDIAAIYQAGGSGFVNPMPNDSPLAGEDSGGTPVPIAVVTPANIVRIGGGTANTDVDALTAVRLRVNGSNRVEVSGSLVSLLGVGARLNYQTMAANAPIGASACIVNFTANSGIVNLGNSVSGRVVVIIYSGASGNMTVNDAVTGGTLAPGEWGLYFCTGGSTWLGKVLP